MLQRVEIVEKSPFCYKTFSVSCLRKLWRCIAMLVVFVAVVISILKYTLPYTDSFRGEIQTWINTEYDADISIGKITAGWETTGPAIILEDITLLTSDATPLDLHIEETRIKLDFWQSIIQQRIKSSYFVLDGVKARVDAKHFLQQAREDSGSTAAVSTSSDSEPVIDFLSHLFLGQLRQFSVQDSLFSLTLPSGRTQHILVEELTWQNDQSFHQGVGEFSVDGIASNSLSFILNLHGDETQPLTGELFVEANEVKLGSWLAELTDETVDITHTSASFRAWADIRNGLFNHINIVLGENEIRWQAKEKEHLLSFGNGRVVWRPFLDGWEIATSTVSVMGDEQLWPDLSFTVEYQQSEARMFVNQLKLDRLLPLLTLGALPDDIEKQITAFSPNASLSDLHLNYDASQGVKFSGNISDVSWKRVGDVPGGQDIDFQFGGFWNTIESVNHNAKSAIFIDGESLKGQFDTGSLFTRPFNYDYLSLSTELVLRDEEWHVKIPSFWMSNSDISFTLAGSVGLGEVPVVNLYAEMLGPKALQAKNYFPKGQMSEQLIEFLNFSVRSGELGLTQVAVAGEVDKFPYDNQEGIVLVRGELVDVDFKFSEKWPQISAMNAELVFRNDRLDIYSLGGDLLNVPIENSTQAVLTPLSDLSTVDIHLNFNAKAEDLTEVLQQSSIKHTVGEALSIIQIESMLTGDIDLVISTESDTPPEEEVLGKGIIHFDNNPISVQSPAIPFDEMTGHLAFDNDTITSIELNGTAWKMPISLTGKAKQGESAYEVALKLAGDWESEALFSHIPSVFSEYLSGHVPFEVDVDLSLPKKGFQYTAVLNADFTHTKSTLPSIYAKPVGEATKLEAIMRGDELSNLLTANYNDSLYFNGILPATNHQFIRSQIILGPEDKGLATGQGLNIFVDLPETNFDPWKVFVQKLIEDSKHHSESLISEPKYVSGRVRSLNVYGQQFDDAKFEMENKVDHWVVDLNAKQTRMQLDVYDEWKQKGIVASIDYLRIQLKEFEEQNTFQISEKWLEDFPKLSVVCDYCVYEKYLLGKVNASAFEQNGQLVLENVAITNGKNKLVFNGGWVSNDTVKGLSKVTGELSSPDFGVMLSTYELPTSIRDSSANVNFSLDWAGGPNNFNFASLGGEVRWELGEGHIAEVSDKGAKIFSLLSLNSIFRRLRLDFSDVFSKGLYYNEIDGDLSIYNGVASTANTRMDGLAGEMAIKGSTNLVSKELDYELAFTPKLTSSLPVIVGWMVNPVSGLAALAIDQVIERANVISEIRFTMTGTIEEPVITEVDRRSREITLPGSKPKVEHAQNQSSTTSSKEGEASKEAVVPQPEIETLPESLSIKGIGPEETEPSTLEMAEDPQQSEKAVKPKPVDTNKIPPLHQTPVYH